MLTNMDLFNTYVRPHLNMIAPALAFAPKESIRKYINMAMVSMKIALRLPITSLIKATLQTLNQIHPWEYIHKAHKRIRKRLKELGYDVRDKLDIEDTQEIKVTREHQDIYDEVSYSNNVDEESYYDNIVKRELARSLMGIKGENNQYPYRKKAGLVFKVNNLKRINPDLQRTYLLIAVTNEMHFYGEDRKLCPACMETLKQYSHV